MTAIEAIEKELERARSDGEFMNPDAICGLSLALDILRAQPSPWVDVRERLPEEGVVVLVQRPSGVVSLWMWLSASDAENCTHWSPLPLPLEKESI